MVDLKAKDEEISNEKKSLQESLDVALLRQQEFEKEVPKLTNEAVSTFDV